jgi:hypothetical protein
MRLQINSSKENQNGQKVWLLCIWRITDWGRFGSLWAANGNILLGMAFGALAGVALGWFIAAAVLEKSNKEK